MSEVVQKQDNDLDNMEEFKAGNDKFAFYDHFSKFSGLAVAQLYLVWLPLPDLKLFLGMFSTLPLNGSLKLL